MMIIFERNIRVIQSRWNDLAVKLKNLDVCSEFKIEEINHNDKFQTLTVNGIHLTSSYDRVNEAKQQANRLPDKPKHIHLYGFALGDLLAIVLDRYDCDVTMHILNLSIFNELLRRLDLSDLLSTKRLTLSYASQDFFVHEPFAVSPVCLQMADDESLVLRDNVQINLASDYISERYHEHQDVWLEQINDNYSNIENDHDVAELYGCALGKQSIVIGAGPSLDTLYEKIKSLKDKGVIIIAVDAAIKSLVQNEIVPDYVVTIDGQRDLLIRFYEKDILAELGEAKLVYLPVVHHDVIDLWHGERYCGYSSLNIFQKVKQRFKRGELYVSGSVIHPAVDLAVKIGSSRIHLAGADFGYPNNVSHVSGSFYGQKIERIAHGKEVLNGEGSKILTIQSLLVYLRDLERYISLHPKNKFINMSRMGARIANASYLDE